MLQAGMSLRAGDDVPLWDCGWVSCFVVWTLSMNEFKVLGKHSA